MAQLRDYVTAADHMQYKQLAEGMVQLNVTHSNLKTHKVLELRLDLHSTVRSVKETLMSYNGTSPDFMELYLLRGEEMVCKLVDDTKMLGFYGPENGWTIHCVDLDPHSITKNGNLEDLSQVEKYKISDEDYMKRDVNFRKWKAEQLAKDPSWTMFPKKPAPEGMDFEDEECVKGIEVGMRCEVSPGERRGVVGHVGAVTGLGKGFWVGVRFDEPVGKGDGTKDGVSYYDCPPGYGAFVRPHKLQVGDYPEKGLDFSDSDDEEEGDEL
jgi:tubulin-folding cofactor B